MFQRLWSRRCRRSTTAPTESTTMSRASRSVGRPLKHACVANLWHHVKEAGSDQQLINNSAVLAPAQVRVLHFPLSLGEGAGGEGVFPPEGSIPVTEESVRTLQPAIMAGHASVWVPEAIIWAPQPVIWLPAMSFRTPEDTFRKPPATFRRPEASIFNIEAVIPAGSVTFRNFSGLDT